MIVLDTGKVNEYLHMFDLHQFGQDRAFSVYIANFDDSAVIMDCGTSFDIKRLLRYLKRNNISFEKVKYIVVTHHHFDHVGGLWKLYNILKENNSSVKIISSLKFMQMINNFELENHYTHARKAFGGLIGELKQIPQTAFRIIKEEEYFSGDWNNAPFLDRFVINKKEVKLLVLKTPGHSPDHICPFFIYKNQVDFVHLGGALGIKNHPTKLITGPSSSAPNFNYETYMQSVDKILRLTPHSIGFSHFGYLSGLEDIEHLIKEHKTFMVDFRNLVIKYYREKPETKYVFGKVWPFLQSITDLREGYTDNPMFVKLAISIVYGMMIDLGYRKK